MTNKTIKQIADKIVNRGAISPDVRPVISLDIQKAIKACIKRL